LPCLNHVAICFTKSEVGVIIKANGNICGGNYIGDE